MSGDAAYKINESILGHKLRAFLRVHSVQDPKRRGRGGRRFVQKLCEFVRCKPVANSVCQKLQVGYGITYLQLKLASTDPFLTERRL